MEGASLELPKGRGILSARCTLLVLDSIQPEKWYSVKEVAGFLGFSEDTIIRLVNRGLLKAFVLSMASSKRKRVFRSRRILGRDLLRFIDGFMNRN
jgi:hypothetical protein